MWVRVVDPVLEDLVPVHLKKRPRNARTVQRHGHRLRPGADGWATAADPVGELPGSVPQPHRADGCDRCPLTHWLHGQKTLHQGGVRVGSPRANELPELRRRRAVHLRKGVYELERVDPDGHSLHALHGQHLPRTQRLDAQPRADGVRSVQGERDADAVVEVREHVRCDLTQVTRLARVIELRLKLQTHAIANLPDLLAHALKPKQELKTPDIHAEEPLHIGVLHLHGDLRPVEQAAQVHLPDGRRGNGLLFELGEDGADGAPQLRLKDVPHHIEGLSGALVQ
mmetsp:Transcript_101693/g.303463  ORF Transcript_101693/g.303463 Transcript_101693/m.303463 type:complete len:283 (-) Transcript_101693:423-1271(-)